MEELHKKSSVKQVILAISIALVFVFFVAYAIQTLYASPEYDRYCNTTAPVDYASQISCEAAGGKWNPYIGEKPIGENRTGYCYSDFKCNEDYNSDREVYERNVFGANVVIGLVVLVASFLLALEAVSNGFMAGGALLIVYGSIRYWGNLSNIFRTVLLGIALVVLIIVGYKKLK